VNIKETIRRAMSWLMSVVALAITAFGNFTGACAAQEKVNLLPPTRFDRFIVYENLALFWIAIIGLIIIIRMKLREIKRTQALDKEEVDAPVLE
jgi:hypothetical protein